MPQIADQTSVVAQVRAGFPTPLGPQHAACLIQIAEAIKQGAGLLKKDAGTFVVLPDGTRVAQDIICFADGHHFDALGDAEGAALPTWQDKGLIDPARFHFIGPVPPPPPPPQHGPDIVERLDSIERKLDRLLAIFPEA